ncbi:VOC family protein [Nocardioides sp. CFH 31398]|uniref:VOC family protein n=1 Tax=Nocardioides sp. CFH 31398 TaxID=2919579 RepID=UPI001F06F3A9|nr:VOC family protein [Nocardioides sp. CFH 31398]MCH1868813.1 4a-hydroxytetrahydrobiopterin dehydratase [Nocardioides sp. CFH 31398]
MEDDSGAGRRLTPPEVAAEGLEDWRLLFDRLHAGFEVGDLAAAGALVAEVARAAEGRERHLDLDVAHGWVGLRLTTPGLGGVSAADVALARAVSSLARTAGATPRPERTAVLELALDSPDGAEVAPFWTALLGYEAVRVEVSGGGQEVELRDPAGRRPSVWFQATRPGPVPSQRWHLDLWLPDEVADDRVAAALAAGGSLVVDDPGCRVLADPQGNHACVVTWRGRETPG